MKSITIPDTIESIGSYSFAHSGLESLTLSENLVEIPYIAFNECYNLTSVIIPDKVKIIDQHAFSDSNLIDIVIGKSVVEIRESAFYTQINRLQNVYFTGLTLPNTIAFRSFAFDDPIVFVPPDFNSDSFGYLSVSKSLEFGDFGTFIKYKRAYFFYMITKLYTTYIWTGRKSIFSNICYSITKRESIYKQYERIPWSS